MDYGIDAQGDQRHLHVKGCELGRGEGEREILSPGAQQTDVDPDVRAYFRKLKPE